MRFTHFGPLLCTSGLQAADKVRSEYATHLEADWGADETWDSQRVTRAFVRRENSNC